jgi:hypothetical protein
MSAFGFPDLPSNRRVFRDLNIHNSNNLITNRIPFYPTANRPQPAPSNKGQIIYDITTNEFCYCNGSAWICLSSGSANTVGILSCTVGNTANTNAVYNSVQAAIDDGCYAVRILDGLTGGQVPGYSESAFDITTIPAGQSMFVYVDPGVDWTFDLSILGNHPVVTDGRTLTVVGGSANRSSLVVTGASANELASSAAGSLLFFQNISLSIPDTASFPTTDPLNLFLSQDGSISISTNTGTAPIFDLISTAAGSADAFIFFNTTFLGGGASVDLFSNVPDGVRLALDNVTIGGAWGSINLEIDGGATLGVVHANGMKMSQTNVFTMRIGTGDNITPGGQVNISQMQDLEGGGSPDTEPTLLNGANFDNCFVGSLTVVGSNNTVSNLRCRSITMTPCSFNNFSNIRIQETLSMDNSTTRNNFSDIQILGDLNISGGENVFSNVQFSGDINLDGEQRNMLNNIVGDGTIAISGTGGDHVINGIRGLGVGPTLSLTSGGSNDISNFRIFTILPFSASENNRFTNGFIAGIVTVSTDGNWFNNCDFQSPFTLGASDNQFNNCRYGTSDWTSAITSGNIVTGCRLEGAITLSGGANATTFPLFVANRGAAPLGNPPATGSDPNSSANSVL